MNARVETPTAWSTTFLMEGQTRDCRPVVRRRARATIEHKHQRVVIGPWRLPDS